MIKACFALAGHIVTLALKCVVILRAYPPSQVKETVDEFLALAKVRMRLLLTQCKIMLTFVRRENLVTIDNVETNCFHQFPTTSNTEELLNSHVRKPCRDLCKGRCESVLVEQSIHEKIFQGCNSRKD